MKTNDMAYPFECEHEWRVWRPDRVPHHFGHYKTAAAALRSADRINAQLGLLPESQEAKLAEVFAQEAVTETDRERTALYPDECCDMVYYFETISGRQVTVRHYGLVDEYHIAWKGE